LLVNPGEMCGPTTQMTLNAFHYAGVSSKNVTLGLLRLKEIINVTTKINMPSLSVYLEPDVTEGSMLAKNVQQELTYTSLRTVTAAVEIRYDPNPSFTIIEEDAVFVESFFAIPDDEIELKLHLQSRWLLHLELDRAKMIDCKLTMAYVAGRIAEPQRVSHMEDSILEKTGHKTSVSSSDSAFFGVDSSHAPPKFRPISSFSIVICPQSAP
jgi:DNA-directed RNA polymerase II subunit RPB1